MQLLRTVTGAACVLALALASGCSNVNTPDPPGGPVSYASQIQPIFDAHCTECHRQGGIGPSVGVAMLLTADKSPESLVNKKSSLDDTYTLVVPGDAASSLIYRMASESNPPVAVRMPPLAAPLSGHDLGLLRDWINQGALDN